MLSRDGKVRNVVIGLTRTDQSRNEKCKCGSGLKYKHCCGKPRSIDAVASGTVITTTFYMGNSKDNATSVYDYVKDHEDRGRLIKMPNDNASIDVISVDMIEDADDVTGDVIYQVELRGRVI